jgi:formate dehydrogenase subunit gamma
MTGKKREGEYIKRFSLFRIIEHQAGIITFTILVVTGLSQKFHDSSLAEWVIMNLGGIDKTRLIHRFTGLVFAALTIVHVLAACYGVMFRKWVPSMVINLKDFTDAIDNLKYYFGITDMPARCGRYDYKQKFEYWGVVVGGLLMIATGLTLWFPTKVFKLIPILPGQIIPAAKAAHTNEAMLAFLVIVIWHIYNSVFSPEIFPLDTSIFTGRLSKERMKHEHPLEYERLFGIKPENMHEGKSADAGHESAPAVDTAKEET